MAESCYERHFAVNEIAELWAISHDTATRLFSNEPGVVVIKRPARKGKRLYRTLRIPQSVAERVYRRMQVAA